MIVAREGTSATAGRDPAGWVRGVWSLTQEALRSRVDLSGYSSAEASEEVHLMALCAVAYFAHYCEWGAQEWNFNVGLLACQLPGDCAQITPSVRRAAFDSLDGAVDAFVSRVSEWEDTWERLTRASLSFWPRFAAVNRLPAVSFGTALAANNRVAAMVGATPIVGDEATYQREDWDGREEPAEGSNPSATPAPTTRTPRPGYTYSATLRREVPNGHCVQSRSDRRWYRAVAGRWVLTQETDAACLVRHPLSAGGGSGGSGGSGGGGSASSSSSSAGLLIVALGAGAVWFFAKR